MHFYSQRDIVSKADLRSSWCHPHSLELPLLTTPSLDRHPSWVDTQSLSQQHTNSSAIKYIFFPPGVECSARFSNVAPRKKMAQGILHVTFVCESSEGRKFGTLLMRKQFMSTTWTFKKVVLTNIYNYLHFYYFAISRIFTQMCFFFFASCHSHFTLRSQLRQSEAWNF